MIFLFIIVPLLLAGLLPLLGKISKRFLPDLLANATMLFLLVLSVVSAKPLIANGGIIQQAFWFGAPLNIRLLLDGFSLFMLFTISLVSFAVTLYSINYMEHYGAKANYYALLLVMIAGMNGLVLSSDLFNIYLFLEVAAVASYALVAFGQRPRRARGLVQVPDAVGRGLGLHPAEHRHHLRPDRRRELRHRRPGPEAR